MSEVEIRSLAELRAWLSAHHATAGTQWLLTFKKPNVHYLAMDDVVDELLCWGWVDSVTGTGDAERKRIRISPRNPASAWSAVNKAKVARLRAEGRMQPAGEARVAAAQANGMWEFLDDVDALQAPPDLIAALAGALPAWEGWPRSIRRGALEWIKTARTPATRAARIAECAAAAREGRRPKPFSR